MGVLRKEKYKYKKTTTLINALINLKSHGYYYYRSKEARSKLKKLVDKRKTNFYVTYLILTTGYFIETYEERCRQPGKVTGFGLTKDDLPF